MSISEIWQSNGIQMLLNLAGAAGLAVGGWALVVLLAVQTDVRVVQSTVNFLVQDRYRADEARRDFQLRDQRLDTMEVRLRSLEAELHSTKATIEQVAPIRRKNSQ